MTLTTRVALQSGSARTERPVDLQHGRGDQASLDCAPPTKAGARIKCQLSQNCPKTLSI